MFKIPSFLSETTPSSVKTGSVYHDATTESTRATPNDIPKSVSRYNLLQSSTARNFSDGDEFRDSSNSFDLSEDPSFWKNHNVQVIIRLRPLSSAEISLQGYSRCVRQENSHTITWTGHPESRFTFDVVADETVSQEKLFRVAGVPMVENTVAGYNSCMFAYGQTGSGKTHTMLGDIEGGTRRHSVNCGMTPRVFEYLFSRIQKEKEARREEKFRFTCKCSFLEIYNEHILDLLNKSSANLQIREDLKKGIYVENLTELEVSSARDVMQQLLQGSVNRKVAATNMNRASSRSHSVFTCVIESNWESQGVTHHRFARLNLVDLAGSERQKSSGAEGERLKEATNINKSLSTLGLVIMNLVSISNGKSLHVPYRDSKLTFLLQDSLGGNSKTIIIANISPSNGCSLETLSTLKFAQRAKFIKNNAIINEDASGDVIAMRMQLKKEVSQLRSLANGGSGNQDSEAQPLSFLGSPGAFKWEGLNSSFSPLTFDKRLSQKKEYEVALAGAFRREKEKDVVLQSLTEENKAVVQLAKQREDEIQGLKMRLKFREAGVKRLEAVASGKISAEAHLLKEKEELLKEIEVLRSQVDRNQEVTRFAMENLRLKEEIRRLKSFYEEGDREKMNEQINTLQNKLLEALDWKLMHETDPSDVQESASPWLSSVKEENEFLQVQVLQHQAEVSSLQKKLGSSLEEKEKLDKHIMDLETELETLRSAAEVKEEVQTLPIEIPSTINNEISNISFSDQLELKAMVDAIAAASQREAEAHEMAISLAKESDELRAKVKVLIDDNSKLIELYERAVEEKNASALDAENGGNRGFQKTEVDTVPHLEDHLRDLEHQLAEMHEENERLMSMYETAMGERDDLKRKLSSALHNNNTVENEKSEFLGKVVDLDEEDFSADTNTVTGLDEHIQSESNFQDMHESQVSENPSVCITTITDKMRSVQLDEVDNTNFGCPGNPEDLTDMCVDCRTCPDLLMRSVQLDEVKLDTKIGGPDDSEDLTDTGIDCITFPDSLMANELVLLREELSKAREKLSSSARYFNKFGVLEEAMLKCEEISREIDAGKGCIELKQQEIESQKIISSDIQSRRALIDSKLAAIRVTLRSIESSVAYFDQREGRAKARVDASKSFFNQKEEHLARLQAHVDETISRKREVHAIEGEVRNILLSLKTKLEEENQRQENERVLFSIDNNVLRNENLPVQECLKLRSKATELLKSEENKTKLQNEIKQYREKLGVIKKDIEDLNVKHQKINNELHIAGLEMQKAVKNMDETQVALRNLMNEKEVLMEVSATGKTEIDTLIAEYQHCIFEGFLGEEEMNILEEDLCTLSIKLEILESERSETVRSVTQLMFKNTDVLLPASAYVGRKP